MIFQWPVQEAVYTRLNGSINGAVFDEDPRTNNVPTPPPYTVVGETMERPFDTHDSDGSEEELTIHTWSRARGSKEIKTIMAQIDTRLHNVAVVLTSGVMVGGFQRTFSQVLREQQQSGETWRHGVMRYRALISQ